MNAPILLLVAYWLLFAFVELTTHFPGQQNGASSPTDTPQVPDTDEDTDDLPFGPTPCNQD